MQVCTTRTVANCLASAADHRAVHAAQDALLLDVDVEMIPYNRDRVKATERG